MMKRVFVSLAVSLCIVSAASAEGICCRISGGASEVVLLGSIHIGSEEMYPFPQAISEAMQSADYWVFECDTASAEAQRLTNEYVCFTDGSRLSDHLSDETNMLLRDACIRIGYPYEMLNAYRVWAASTVLSARAIAVHLGENNSAKALILGVEQQVMAQHESQPLLYLETAEEQLTMLDSFSLELQEALLIDACQTILFNKGSEHIKQWPAWWRFGDRSAFAQAFELEMNAYGSDAVQSEYRQKTLIDRNHRMAERIAEWLNDPEGHRYFITVGLMHLVAEQESIPALLAKMGYTVTWQ